MTSFFSRIYKYKESDLKNNKENFLSEIFAFCLLHDSVFLQSFLTLLNITDRRKILNIKTQHYDEVCGIPDIILTLDDNYKIIIEVKINSLQRENQLNDYSKLLLKNSRNNNYLVYLTKYYEDHGKITNKINFVHIRWYQIYEIINTKSIITTELKKFLKDEKMSNKIDLTKSDISSILYTKELLFKMDDFLSLLKEILKELFKETVKSDESIKEGNWGKTVLTKNANIWSGFYQYESHPEILLGVSVKLSKNDKRILKFSKFLCDDLKWDKYPVNPNHIEFVNCKKISAFFIKDKFSAQKALLFLENGLKNIKQLL